MTNIADVTDEASIGESALNDRLVWNRCDVCGQYIALKDFYTGIAVRHMVTPDSYYSSESYETLCKEHKWMG